MKKISNDQNIVNLRRRELLWYAMIIFYVAAIIVSFVCLFVQNLFLLGTALLLFLFATQINKKRALIAINKIDDINKDKEIEKVGKELENIRNRNQKKR